MAASFMMNCPFAQSVSHRPALDKGNLEIPQERNMVWNNHSDFADTIFASWSARELKPASGKVNNPRILLAKLLLKQDIAKVNEIILQTKPWGVTGSSWALNKKGDYDFTMTVLTTILYFFGDQPSLLYPETTKHLLDVLLIEQGNHFRYKAPKTLGLADETENHLLMTEGSRYLKNRWKQLKGNTDPYFDNVANGMETKLSALLTEMVSAGLYEFNSLPYTGYTITALLNLEAFASDKIRKEARDVLDYMNWCYAIGSYQLKHFAPMRRRYDKNGFQELTTDYHSVFMKSWLGYYPVKQADHNIKGADVHAIIGSCMPYRPADKVVQLLTEKGEGYFIQIGHGKNTCPEIYAAGKNFLLSAGGTNRGRSSQLVARPIMLFLNDNATNVSGTFHIAGPGADFMHWNNTGVYKNFACAAGPVHIPEGYKPVLENGQWQIFSYKDSQCIAVHSTNQCGIILISTEKDPKEFLQKIIAANPDPQKLATDFQIPNGSKLEYDLNAARNKWVIRSVNNTPTDQNFDAWPRMNGEFYAGLEN